MVWLPTDATPTLDLAVLLPEEFRLPVAPPPRVVASSTAPTKPVWLAGMTLAANACAMTATPIAAISHNSEAGGADR